MENKSLTEILHGKEYADLIKQFDQGVEEIEKKHINFFKERTSTLPTQKHDKLNNHFFTYKNWSGMYMGINKNSELPLHIKAEVESLFNQIFNPK